MVESQTDAQLPIKINPLNLILRLHLPISCLPHASLRKLDFHEIHLHALARSDFDVFSVSP